MRRIVCYLETAGPTQTTHFESGISTRMAARDGETVVSKPTNIRANSLRPASAPLERNFIRNPFVQFIHYLNAPIAVNVLNNGKASAASSLHQMMCMLNAICRWWPCEIAVVRADVVRERGDVDCIAAVAPRAAVLALSWQRQPTSCIRYFHAVQSRCHRYTRKSSSLHPGRYVRHAASKAARAWSKVSAVPAGSVNRCARG